MRQVHLDSDAFWDCGLGGFRCEVCFLRVGFIVARRFSTGCGIRIWGLFFSKRPATCQKFIGEALHKAQGRGGTHLHQPHSYAQRLVRFFQHLRNLMKL